MENKFPVRKHPRLKEYDYGSDGYYFVTFCVKNMRQILSAVDVVRSVKTMITRELGYLIWQDSYYERVIRGDESYRAAWQYIDDNPAKWAEDKYYSQGIL